MHSRSPVGVEKALRVCWGGLPESLTMAFADVLLFRVCVDRLPHMLTTGWATNGQNLVRVKAVLLPYLVMQTLELKILD